MRRFLVFLALLLGPAAADEPVTPLEQALQAAAKALDATKHDEAWHHIERALERDARSLRAWELRARWAETKPDRGELVYSLHKLRRLAIAQGEPKERIETLRARLQKADPVAGELLDLKAGALAKLLPLATKYEKKKRRHSAIRVHQEILSLDPEREESRVAIQRISAAPDPSLAETAKATDPLDGVSGAWMHKHDARHGTWKRRAKHKGEHYTIQTDAGYEVLVRAAVAMDQMNAFYRVFFRHGTVRKPKSVPRIDVNIFRTRDEYLTLGQGPPVRWSAGHFTGGAVETYLHQGGFDATTRTLFHEAAHQFVSLATNASGWLNEGLASFFEGCRIQANGTVLMNMPADHRLFPLARRLAKGWMAGPTDGIDANDPSASKPPKAPTWRIIIENKYEWDPPWYAPTWGVVYFLYNYQDPVDGRFVYRAGLRRFVDKSGGRIGEGAVRNFEKVVLGGPQAPTPGVDFAGKRRVPLPRAVEELDQVWKKWILELRDIQSGKSVAVRPYLDWARHAITRKAFGDASEHFEKGLVATPDDVELLTAFADHLVAFQKNKDRAAKLSRKAIRILEAADVPDAGQIAALERRLDRLDPSRETLKKIRAELSAAAHSIVKRYTDAGHDLMVMDLSRRFADELAVPGMLPRFEAAARRSRRSLALWRLAYNERDLSGWAGGSSGVFHPDGSTLFATFGRYEPGRFDYQSLSLDQITSGDFSLETEVHSERGKNAFCGLIFGRKSGTAYHALVFFPGVGMTAREGEGSPRGFVDLASFYGPGVYKIWRHNPVDTSKKGWHKLRLDVTGRLVDVWFDGELVVSHEFGSLDVVRGSFGLITGRGEVRFRNIRYLARKANDPAARIERELRMEPFKVAGKAVAGSWLEQIPPWPEAEGWVQSPRKSWDEKGPVPTLFVIWSIKQNRLLPIHKWLAHLQRRYADAGLEIVSVSEPEKLERVRAHLRQSPFPGSVGVDSIASRGGYGNTLDTYEVGKRFNLPRLLLLDIDQRVVWEGGPGFAHGRAWQAGTPSYLDTPLAELVEKRKLRRLFAWRKAWAGKRDFEATLQLLAQSRELPARAVPAVGKARRVLRAIEGALTTLERTARKLAKEGREPAVRELLAWADRIGRPVDARTRKAIRSVLKSKRVKAWDRVLTLARKAAPARAGEESVRTLIGKIQASPGPFPKSLAKSLEEALAAGDLGAARRRIEEAAKAPALWLARDYFDFYR